MKLALNHRGDYVRADAVGPYSFGLRCPHCKEPVYARSGSVREAHFAHRNGNANKDCEEYYPGGDVWQSSGKGQLPRLPAKERFGAPALLWRSGEALAASLYLRLLSHPLGFESMVRVSSFATGQYAGSDLTKPVFVRLRLQTPPGKVHTSPVNELIEQALVETLAQFRLTGNFFKATGEGGTLVPPDQPLELGQSYWLLTQSQLVQPVPDFVRIKEHRADRTWQMYLIELVFEPEDEGLALSSIARYLSRDVIRRCPSVSLIWPRPDRLDIDGVRVFDNSVKELLVRSTSGPPRVRLQNAPDLVGEHLEKDLYSIKFATKAPEALVGLLNGRWERVRFEACKLRWPGSVWLSNQEERVALFEPRAEHVVASSMPFQIEVPDHRLWRRLLVDEQTIKPIPDGFVYETKGPFSEIKAGAFGSTKTSKGIDTPIAATLIKLESFVRAFKGNRAAIALRTISNHAALLRWAKEHRATMLLPKLMFELAKGEE